MKNVFGSLSLALITLIFCLCVLTNHTFAQDLDDVTISGKIVDVNGGIVIGSTVTAILVDQKVKRTTTTDQNGLYRIIELQPGKYSIRVNAKGFGIETKTDLETISGQNIKLDFTLVPADVRAEQTVSTDDSDAPVIDITRTVVGGTVTSQEIEELPNTSNDILDLVFTLGGTAEESLSIRNLASDDRIGGGDDGSNGDEPSGVQGTGSISLAGGAAYSTNITIDGLDNNDDRTAEERFQPSIDAVAEVQVITNQFSAEYGRASGGRINIRTKAGSKKILGRFSMFFEDESLNANTSNNKRRGLSRLPYSEYEPAATLGGPIPFSYFKDKTYFFSSYSYRERAASSQIFTALPVEQNPLLPLPVPTNPELTRPNLNDPNSALIATFIDRVPTPQRRHRFTQRIDHNFTDTHNLTFNYQVGRSDGFRQYRETSRFLPETFQGRIRNNDSFYITDNYVINSNFVNQFRFQYSNYRPDFKTKNPTAPVVYLNIDDDYAPVDPNPPFPNLPEDDRTSGDVVIGNSTANFSNTRNETRYQFQETANFVIGDFNLRAGADIQNINSTTTELLNTTGTFRFNDTGGADNVDNFLKNQVITYQRNSDSASTINNTYSGFFFQGDWRFRSNITLNAGVRYERESLIDDNNNFGPRLALAYSPGDSGKSVIRLGGGIFYNRALLRTVDDSILDATQVRFNSNDLDGDSNETSCFDPVSPSNTDECVFLRYISDRFPNPLTLAEIRQVPGINNIDAGFEPETFFRRLEDNIKIPESYQFNVGYERDIGKGFAFEVNFTYNKAFRLWREVNINATPIPAGFDNFTDYLLSLGDIKIPGTTSTNGTDVYRFVLGDPTDTNGDTNPDTGADCNSSTPICVVNLNTLNRSTAGLEPIGIARRVVLFALGSPIHGAGLDQIEQVGSMGKSVYEGLSFELRRRFRDLGYGFRSSMRFSYVLSRTRDDGFTDTSSAQVAGDFGSEFSRSLTDRRHRFRFSGTMETPYWFGRLRFSPILRVESGRPFNVSIGGSDRNLDGVRNDRPNFTGDLNDIAYRTPGDPPLTALADRFSLAPIGSSGNLPRNAGNGPALFTFDLNVSRQFKINERFRIRPQISFDNVLNTTVFSFGSDFIDLATAGTPEFEQGFLTPSRTMRQRRIQIGVRVDF